MANIVQQINIVLFLVVKICYYVDALCRFEIM